MNKPIGILLADDHTIVRQGLARLLEEQPDLQILGEAINGQAVIDKALELEPDIIIMDIAMPLLNGIEAAKRVRKSLPDCKIIILSMYSHEHYIHQLLETGVSGYLLKDSSGQEIIKAVRAAMNNKIVMSPAISQKVEDAYLSPQKTHTREKRYESLSNREREVFQLIAEGFCTVKSHRAKIMEKLGLKSPVELGRFAIKLGLVDPDF
jgi:DNA-binding NarL/FixJ family response regulator